MDKKEQVKDQEIIEEQELVDENREETEETEEAEVIDTVNSELESVKQEKEEVYQRMLRVQAEFDNFRKRTQREKEADRKYKSQSLATELLPVVDNFERALNTEVKDESTASFIEGVKMVYRQLTAALEKEGIEVVKTEGEVFDPQVHQAVMQVEDDQYESNVVVEELQKGYKLNDRVIRPAMVKVNQ
ncbi:nucleotide exchange factor GrpE [Aquibacillus saliphilus]|uniref:nucleotide exchange factor GrpE n=1 Tax=Aquibacillus saliphilus TaxID=1909422 RepID=UPI0021064E76|nr:nucleotide exchange factor GrpE [Aquibacillus saliphilus]